jgi:hypothetical protein
VAVVALAVLHECRTREPFRAALAEIKEQMGPRSLELTDLLIMPIQRVPRYAWPGLYDVCRCMYLYAWTCVRVCA